MLKLSFCSLSEWVHDARNRKKQRPHQKEKKFLPINRSPGYFMGSYEENFSCFKAYTYTRDSAADQKHTMIHCTSHHTCIYIYIIISYILSYMISYLYIYIHICVCHSYLYPLYMYTCIRIQIQLQPWSWWPHQMLKAPKSVWHLAQRDTSMRARYGHVVQGLVKRWILTAVI